MAICPFSASVCQPSIPAAAGMPSVRAMMALCAVAPPSLVAMPLTWAVSMRTVSDGVSSSASTITSPGSTDRSCRPQPRQMRSSCCLRSSASAARSAISSSPRERNICASSSNWSSIAAAAFCFCSRMRWMIGSRTEYSSPRIVRWASKISASCSPIFSFAVS